MRERVSDWRMVHEVNDATMEGRRFFHFGDFDATANAVRAYRVSHLERGWVDDVYVEHFDGWRWDRVVIPVARASNPTQGEEG